MWYREMTFYTQGYDVTTQKGEVLPIYKGTGTLGTIRNWFRQTNRQMDVYTDAIMDINNYLLEIFPLYYGVIDRGSVKQLKEIFPSHPLEDFQYYISIPIYQD